MDITLIAIALLIFIAIVSLLLFLYKSINKKSFKAEDGSVFDNKSDLDIYNSLYEKTKQLFSIDEVNDSSQSILGFDRIFLTKLTRVGFQDLRTIVKYRKEFQSLSDLINT